MGKVTRGGRAAACPRRTWECRASPTPAENGPGWGRRRENRGLRLPSGLRRLELQARADKEAGYLGWRALGQETAYCMGDDMPQPEDRRRRKPSATSCTVGKFD
ncbi:Hypothetical_protein [Hexamita inflata]|uniref:Hypothetical_protein n=1 Tax=Hexamita inflata TaxID=28002 RepID=A0AA86TNG1_9EUKA|nr:Hypothetical protein HINF_LOCUS11519 [Hexamita inflata]